MGPGAPQWQRLEAICQEYLAAHPVEPSNSEREQVLRWPVSVAGWLESAREALEGETRRWAFLCPDLWMDVCRAGGLSEITPDFDVTPGSVGMDPPEAGDDYWSAQIGSNDLNFAAILSLINILDHASRTRVPFDVISVT